MEPATAVSACCAASAGGGSAGLQRPHDGGSPGAFGLEALEAGGGGFAGGFDLEGSCEWAVGGSLEGIGAFDLGAASALHLGSGSGEGVNGRRFLPLIRGGWRLSGSVSGTMGIVGHF